MTKHVKYGGSTAARTIQCPAWYRLSDDVPTGLSGGSNPAADEGSMLHACMEEIYNSDETAQTVINELLESGEHYNAAVLTQELVFAKLLPAVEAVESIMDEYDVDDWMVEPYVEIDAETAGSIDLLMRSSDDKTVIVLDYKFGFHNVSPTDNAQLKFYALAASVDEKTEHWFDGAEQVVLAIVQPNDNGDVLQTDTVAMNVVDMFESTLINAISLTNDPEQPPKSGPACKYCPAHAICPEKTGAALKATRINEVTADKLAEYLPMAEEVVAWAKEVQAMAHAQLELGTPIKGYKLVNKRASRVWNDTTAVESKIRKAKKIKLDDGFDLKLKSPAQLEKVCKQLGVDFQKQYSQYTSSVSSGTTLAKESDKRPAAIPVMGLAQLNAMND